MVLVFFNPPVLLMMTTGSKIPWLAFPGTSFSRMLRTLRLKMRWWTLCHSSRRALWPHKILAVSTISPTSPRRIVQFCTARRHTDGGTQRHSTSPSSSIPLRPPSKAGIKLDRTEPTFPSRTTLESVIPFPAPASLLVLVQRTLGSSDSSTRALTLPSHSCKSPTPEPRRAARYANTLGGKTVQVGFRTRSITSLGGEAQSSLELSSVCSHPSARHVPSTGASLSHAESYSA